MAYKKGMPRFKKEGKKYVAHEAGDYFKSEGKYLPISESTGSDVVLTEDDFQKSLDELESITKGGDLKSRKEDLLEKAMTAGGLSLDERDELYKALGGEGQKDEEENVSTQLKKSFTDSVGVQDALDVSEYIEAQHGALMESFDRLGEVIEKSEARTHEFRLVFARALHQVGNLVKSMDTRLETLETQPVRGPKSQIQVGAEGKVVEKSFSDNPPAGASLSTTAILDALEGMMIKSGNGVSPSGEDIAHATAKFEQTKQISKGLLGDIIEFRKSAH